MVRLRDKSWLQSQHHKDKIKFTDLSTASQELAAFVKKFIRRMAKMGVPIECHSASYEVAFLSHSRRRNDLSVKEWEILGHIGAEVSKQNGLGVRWGGPEMPSCWMGTRDPPEPVTPAAGA